MTAATTTAASGTTAAAATRRIPWQAKFLTLALIWGSSFLLMKFGLRALAPIQIAALRIVFGAAIVYALLRASGGRLPRSASTWGHILVASVFLTALPFTLFALGETRVSSALAGIGNSITPIAMVVFALLLIPAEKVTRGKLLAIAIGFAGVVVISEPWSSTGRPDLVGFGITLAGGACYGIGWPYIRRFLGHADLGGLSQPAAVLIAGTGLMVPVSLVWWWTQRSSLSAPWSTASAATSHDVWVALAATVALGAIGTGVAYTLQFDVVRDAGAVVSSTVTYLIPVVSVLLGVLVLDEHLGLPQLAGFALVLAAALIVGRPTGGWRRLIR